MDTIRTKVAGKKILSLVLTTALATAGLGLVSTSQMTSIAQAEEQVPAAEDTGTPVEGEPATDEAANNEQEEPAQEAEEQVQAEQTETVVDTSTISYENVTVNVTNQATLASQLLDQINQARSNAGLSQLTQDTTLDQAAWQRAAESIVLKADARPDGTAIDTAAPGYTSLKEVLISGDATTAGSAEAVAASMESGDAALSASYTTAGIGVVLDADGVYHWALLLSATPAATVGAAVTADGAQTYTVQVVQSNVEPATAGKDQTLEVGATTTLSLSAHVAGEVSSEIGTLTLDSAAEVVLDPSVTGAITWTSSDANTASVDANGVVTALAAGTTTITATSDTGLSENWAVTVTDPNTQANTEAEETNSEADAINAVSTLSAGDTLTTLEAPVEDQTITTINLADCTINGITELAQSEVVDADGNFVTPLFSLVEPDGATPVPTDQYTTDFTVDTTAHQATLTLTAIEGSTQFTGSKTQTFDLTYESTDAPEENSENSEDNQVDTLANEESTENPEQQEQVDTAVDATEDADANTDTDTDLTDPIATTLAVSTDPTTDENVTPADDSEDTTAEATESDEAQSDVDESASIDKIDIALADVTPITTQTYTGEAIEPAFTVTVNGTELVKDTDYTVTYSDNVNVGIVTVTLTGIGNYTGTRTTSFEIASTGKSDLEAAGFSIQAIPDQTYSGSAIQPQITVSGNGTTLSEGKDYNVTYADNVNAGTATVTVTAMDNSDYTGTLTATFAIQPVQIANVATIRMPNQFATGSALTPKPVSVTYNDYTLQEGVDYQIVGYSNNTAVGTATATLQGMGNYTGTVDANFEILNASDAKADASGNPTVDPGVTPTLPRTGDTTSRVAVIGTTAAGVALIAGGVGLVLRKRSQSKRNQ